MKNKKSLLYKTLVYEAVAFFVISEYVRRITGISFIGSIWLNTTILVGRIASRYLYDIYYDRGRKWLKKKIKNT